MCFEQRSTHVPGCSYIVDSYVMGPTGLGSGVIDGVSLDDGWFDVQQAGANDCTGSPVGGPTEVDSFCAVDMGLTQASAHGKALREAGVRCYCRRKEIVESG